MRAQSDYPALRRCRIMYSGRVTSHDLPKISIISFEAIDGEDENVQRPAAQCGGRGQRVSNRVHDMMYGILSNQTSHEGWLNMMRSERA